jgi:hypothetical protein
MNPGENLGWCKPYVSDRVKFVINEGRVLDLMIDGEHYDGPEPDFITGKPGPTEGIRKAAQIMMGDDYSDYEGYTDEEMFWIAFHDYYNLKETGCTQCPFFAECDAMDDYVDDDSDDDSEDE